MTVFVSPKPAQQQPRPAKVQQVANFAIIAGFLLITGLPFLGVFQRGQSLSIEQSEGRVAEKFPENPIRTDHAIPSLDRRLIKQFPLQFEKWFNDRIGFRRQLIQVFQVARYYGWTPAMLSKSGHSNNAAMGVMGHLASNSKTATGQPQVLIGRDGWLFYQSDNAVNDYRGTNLFSQAELAEWKQVLTQRNNWLAKRGIRYLFVITPNKHSVYPEFMPRSINRVSENSRLEQLADYLKRESDVEFINLLDPLVAAKSQERVFHKTDTHWNSYGAFIGAQTTLQRLKQWYPEVHVPALSDYRVDRHDCDLQSVHTVSPWVKMDLAVMLASPIPYREDVIDLVPMKPELQVPIQFYGSPKSDADRYRQHAHPHGKIPKVYVLHDSFMTALSPFLAPNFQEATYKWTNQFPAEEIEKAKPALVIQQLVQRRLMELKPNNPPSLTNEIPNGN